MEPEVLDTLAAPVIKRSECAICYDVQWCYALECEHSICKDCAFQIFSRASVDEYLMRCCGRDINTSIARAVLPSDQYHLLETRLEERLAEDKMCAMLLSRGECLELWQRDFEDIFRLYRHFSLQVNNYFSGLASST